ncbi:conserved exported hypothetical protein [Candidatus Sulfopaludibacter sp. SbA4]|nr:conserved exported hypothetical protein [Candidatus Sulfopaludibacter sp. SbA4]
MRTRRNFLQSAAALTASRLFAAPRLFAADAPLASQRPPAGERKFTSDAVEAKIQEVKKSIADPQIAWLFENCYPNTLDTTVTVGEADGKLDTFVITGDIRAMWLRDSTGQVMPYLPLIKADKKLRDLLLGVIGRQSRSILLDPYANAFNYGPSSSEWAKDVTQMRPGLHERKWEIDSLCYPVRLAHGFWKITGDASIFDKTWQDATALIVKTWRDQQRLYSRGTYTFQRVTANSGDSLPQGGYGNPTRPCGLIHSGFRPSDDACIFPLLIPSNLFAAASLDQLAEIYGTELNNQPFAGECQNFAEEVRSAVSVNARARHPRHGEIYAYEADGFGNQLMMDDANIPSLLALPYLGCVKAEDPLYQRTRAFVLSDDNPYFFRGPAGEGLGGPHSGTGMIWPMGIITRALTSTNEREMASCLAMLKATHAGTGFMHESFSRTDATRYTRKWFAWANSLFGELIVKLHESHPAVLRG